MKSLDTVITYLYGLAVVGKRYNIDVEHIYRYTKTIRMASNILSDLTKSIEFYEACNKPQSEWDEYDHMMYPIWLRLKEFMEN